MLAVYCDEDLTSEVTCVLVQMTLSTHVIQQILMPSAFTSRTFQALRSVDGH